ncbi:hypothetical protein C4573_00680 [Candidatus Woesearchaeota archaeon]|nr:MAG: hypothetical protein C4573_00680 [Candidatus Woesearchaeota archaeon]
MEKIKTFVKQFCEFDIPARRIGRRYYLVSDELWNLKDTIKRDIFSLGTFLGENKDKFYPSLALLEIIAKKTDKKVMLNEKASWLFLCKREVFVENLIEGKEQTGLVLVQNERNENLGYGVMKRVRQKLLLKPVLDRGDFLRRES